MKKTILLTLALAVLAGGLAFAADPPTDFKYDLNEAGDGVVITGYLAKKTVINIPAEIEGFPVVELRGRFDVNVRMNLTSIVIPDSVTRIGESCFESAPKLRAVTLPKNLKEIGEKAFAYCALTAITLPQGLTTIGGNAFLRCPLTTVTIPNSVTSIGASAFEGCPLTTVTIQPGITTIWGNVFSKCPLTTVTIPEGVTTIEGGAFSSCSALTTVTIPDSVTRIGGSAFGYCAALTTVNINPHPIEFDSYYDRGEKVSDSFRDYPRLSLAVRKKIQDCGYTGIF